MDKIEKHILLRTLATKVRKIKTEKNKKTLQQEKEKIAKFEISRGN